MTLNNLVSFLAATFLILLSIIFVGFSSLTNYGSISKILVLYALVPLVMTLDFALPVYFLQSLIPEFMLLIRFLAAS